MCNNNDADHTNVYVVNVKLIPFQKLTHTHNQCVTGAGKINARTWGKKLVTIEVSTEHTKNCMRITAVLV